MNVDVPQLPTICQKELRFELITQPRIAANAGEVEEPIAHAGVFPIDQVDHLSLVELSLIHI